MDCKEINDTIVDVNTEFSFFYILNVREPFIKLLYLTPERIVKGTGTRQVLQDLYQNEMLARFVIDEAHCVSSWGHDFRKDYSALRILKDEFPETPIMALTATARNRVAVDTMKILRIENCVQFNTGNGHYFISC